MSNPYLGEIRMFGGNFAPVGWALCDGKTMDISQNTALFQLIGTTYGGDGQTTFNLPELQGRIPIHAGTLSSTGTTYILGQAAGTEQVTLTTSQIPVHNHAFTASTALATAATPANNLLGQSSLANMYIERVPDVTLAPQTVGAMGGSQPHDNMQPFLCVTFIISLFGVFPSQT